MPQDFLCPYPRALTWGITTLSPTGCKVPHLPSKAGTGLTWQQEGWCRIKNTQQGAPITHSSGGPIGVTTK